MLQTMLCHDYDIIVYRLALVYKNLPKCHLKVIQLILLYYFWFYFAGFLNPHNDPYSRSISNHGLMDQIAGEISSYKLINFENF